MIPVTATAIRIGTNFTGLRFTVLDKQKTQSNSRSLWV